MLHRSLTYPALMKDEFIEHLVFFDIETTGFSARFHHVALISLGYQQGELFVVEQFLAQRTDEEGLILVRTLKALQDAPLTVTYNGNQFDIPFMNQRLKALDQGWEIEKERSLDLYRALGKGKLKHNEALSGFVRTDTLSGKQWAELYKTMIKGGDPSVLEALLLHNAEDVYALYHLMAKREDLRQIAGQRIYNLGGIMTLQNVVVGKNHVRVLLHSPKHGQEVLELPLFSYHQYMIYPHPSFDELDAEDKKNCFLVENDHVHLDRLHTLIHQIEKQKN